MLPFDDLDPDWLARRRSVKWRRYPVDVLPAWVAEMDFPLAEPIVAALRTAVESGDTGYVDPDWAELGASFAAFADRQFGWPVDPAQVALVPDVNAGVAELVRIVTEPGDGVVLNTPAYPPFFAGLADVGRRAVRVPMRLDPAAGWTFDLVRTEQAFRAGARCYLLCNPHNPTGRVFTRAELLGLAELVQRYQVTVISDEIHAPLVLPGATYVPWLSLGEGPAGHGVALLSASKAFDLAGLKCALVVTAHPRMQAMVSRVPDEVPFRASILGAIATVAAFTAGDAWLDALRTQLDGTRRLLAELLAKHLPAVGYRLPEASYLAWLDCRALGLGGDPAAAFLDRGRVALVRGLDFGDDGWGYARLNIGTSSSLVAEAVRRMAVAVGPENGPRKLS
ncbi:MAG: aminotransferase class I/II-fold pyridoxal phosphate-dependent enzyme [Sporichthyaceae bacterium]|nr:aminotransferase class I/II-fold pyridoxal phosphate-dependent enzyme [Sporichthyaceae bacterium]